MDTKIGNQFSLTVSNITFVYNQTETTDTQGVKFSEYFNNCNMGGYILPDRVVNELREYMKNSLRTIVTSNRNCQHGICLHTFLIAE
jgi:hypothetical protein